MASCATFSFGTRTISRRYKSPAGLCPWAGTPFPLRRRRWPLCAPAGTFTFTVPTRSEEHTSELQSQSNLVCHLLLFKNKMGETLLSNNELSFFIYTYHLNYYYT